MRKLVAATCGAGKGAETTKSSASGVQILFVDAWVGGWTSCCLQLLLAHEAHSMGTWHLTLRGRCEDLLTAKD
jgi:hypothetical protein